MATQPPHQQFLDPNSSCNSTDGWSPASTVTAGRCPTPSTPLSHPVSLASEAGSVTGAPSSNHAEAGSEQAMSPPIMSPPPRPQDGYTASSLRSRKPGGPSEIEKHKEEIIKMYAASTNKAIRSTLMSRYNIRTTEKQLKRVLRIWKAYKNDRGIRKATIARKHNKPPRGSRGQRKQREQNAPRPPRRVENTPSNDSEDDSDIEEVFRREPMLDDDSSTILEYNSTPKVSNQPSLQVPRAQVPAPSSPALSIRGSSGPTLQIPASSPTAPFSGHNDNFSFSTSPLGQMASPIMPFSSTPPFPSMTPLSPSGSFKNPRDRIAQLFMEAVSRFPGVYKLHKAPDRNHWSVYRNLQNVHEQRLRQGVLVAQQDNDFAMLEETVTTQIVPMYEELDLLAVVGIVATFAALKSQNMIGALLYHLRTKIQSVPDRHRANMQAVLNCFRDLLIHHNGDAELFHEDLQSALSNIPPFIQNALGRQSLVGIHLIFLLNLGDTNDIMQEALADSNSNDAMLRLATSYLLAGKYIHSEGSTNPQTRRHVSDCYKTATHLNKMLDNQGVQENDERKQDLYHYLLRVGMWQVTCQMEERLQPGYYGADVAPPVALLEESILYGERCLEDGPQSPIVIQAVNMLIDMYAKAGDYWQAEVTGLRLQAVNEVRKRNRQRQQQQTGSH
ncbi:hypothetical protein MKZ38_004423 [Zalerion maritima]|uniref:Clr5 domain-containing protein n=1 Tax=Zalerion maritima TaxID=339359 RepID=A0AAD5WPJ5_9PEZI|nr:hypothetical protein MKZ38_004423 [Zalerion maritima]